MEVRATRACSKSDRMTRYLAVLEQRRLVAGGFCKVAEHGAGRVYTRAVRPSALAKDAKHVSANIHSSRSRFLPVRN